MQSWNSLTHLEALLLDHNALSGFLPSPCKERQATCRASGQAAAFCLLILCRAFLSCEVS